MNKAHKTSVFYSPSPECPAASFTASEIIRQEPSRGVRRGEVPGTAMDKSLSGRLSHHRMQLMLFFMFLIAPAFTEPERTAAAFILAAFLRFL